MIVDDDMKEMPRGTIGRLAVRGPIGCRYLADDRQRAFVRDGWNLTGDSFMQDDDGYFHFAARSDDIIVSPATISPAPRSRQRCSRMMRSSNVP